MQGHAAVRTNRGVEVLIDAETLDIIGGRSVFLASRGRYPAIKLNGKKQKLHRLVLDAPDGVHVDHIDGNVLDCRRANLRLCSHGENMRNSRMPKNNTSGRKGVRWHRRDKKWVAQIWMDGQSIHLGLFTCLEDAANAYDAAARNLHGEFAKTNEDLGY